MVNVVLKDSGSRIVRSYRLGDENQHELVMMKDTGRLELVKSSTVLKQEGLEFDLIDKVSIKSLHANPVKVGHLTLAISNTNDRSVVTPDLSEENDDERLLYFTKASGLGHFSALFMIFVIGFAVQKWFTPVPEEKPVEVVILPPQELPKTQPKQQERPTVKMAEEIKPVRKAVVRKVVQPKPVVKRLVVKNNRPAVTQGLKKAPRAEIGTLKTLAKIGGIGADTRGRNAGTGFGSGSGAFGNKNGNGGGLGSGVNGGIKNALSGKGLVGGLSGEGSRAYGAQGYGSDNYGGGRLGHGGGSVGSKVGNLMVPDFNEGEVNGGLTREQVEAVVRRNSGQLAFCYEKALQAQKDLRGRLTLEWVVAASGGVSRVSVASSSLRSKSVENCVVASVKKWKFPRPVGGVNVDVSYPFDFGRLNLMAKGG
ncbi:MAG: TonB family protein [Bdellovibrionaceae bacterium]|nr:TonB family protein [Pseudobdellovibrionaceae bacterium]